MFSKLITNSTCQAFLKYLQGSIENFYSIFEAYYCVMAVEEMSDDELASWVDGTGEDEESRLVLEEVVVYFVIGEDVVEMLGKEQLVK